MNGHLKLYSCLCSESAAEAASVPDVCQGHLAPVVAEAANDAPGGFITAHSCSERVCSGGLRDLTGTPAYLLPVPKEAR